MANAKKCDRCGKYYTDKDKKFTINGYSIYSIGLRTKQGYMELVYDLCDDCTKDLFHFLSNEPVVVGTEVFQEEVVME